MRRLFSRVLLGLAVASAASATLWPRAAAAQERPAYGASITLDAARRAAAAAEAEARKNGWRMAIAIVDTHGFLVYYAMLDDTQSGSANIAVEKAKTAAMFRRPTKEFEENVASGRMAILGLPGVTPVEGGLPIVIGGRIVGAIGVSGMSSAQDGVVAKAGADAVAKL
jgi:uncharacterized protein GlcG (DUF336 family)